MMLKRFSFSDPVWLIPAVIVFVGCAIQSLHLREHSRYCKTSEEWRSVYDQKALSEYRDLEDDD